MAGAYDYDATVDVQWPFGFGLSYTTFEYSNLSLDKPEFASDDTLKISVDVKNTGDKEGMDAVILYSKDLIASITPDVLRVRRFDKINLKPGESKTVEFSLPASDLAFVGYDGEWIIEKGDFEFIIGGKTVKGRCSDTRKL